MKKKILISVLAILVLLGNMVFATEPLTPSIDADTLTNTALVGEDNTSVSSPDNSVATNDIINNSEIDGSLLTNDTPEEINSIVPSDWSGDNDEALNFETRIDADVFEGEEETYLASNKEINGNGFYTSKELNVANLIVHGDLWLAGNNINLNNVRVYGNIYIAANNVKMEDAAISGNMYAACNSIEILASAFQDIFSAASSFVINNNSYILRNLNVAAANIDIANTVIVRNANLHVDNLKILEATSIEGSLNYISKQEIEIPVTAVVNNTNFTFESEDNTSYTSDIITSVLMTIITSALICAFILVFAKKFVENQKAENLPKFYMASIAKGAVATVFIPILIFILFCTGYGVGAGFILLGIYIILFAISLSVVSTSIATVITKKMEYNFWKVYGISILVAVVISLLQKVAVIGTLLTFIVGLLGMGLIFAEFKIKKAKEEVKEA